VLAATGREIARGLVVYDSNEARRLMGLHSNEFEARLGYQGRDELIHRDNLVLIDKKS
jgi:glutamate 5-kinase